MTDKLLATYGLKWDPFSPDVPVEALWVSSEMQHFLSRVRALLRDGGFALITGEPGSGKSVALRFLAHHLQTLPDVLVGVISRPQSALADFYRELGDLFGVSLVPHNRWAGFKTLRQKWLSHLDTALHRPVLLVDEAQEMHPPCSPKFACSRALTSTPARSSPPCCAVTLGSLSSSTTRTYSLWQAASASASCSTPTPLRSSSISYATLWTPPETPRS